MAHDERYRHFLIDRTGRVVKRFPDDVRIEAAVRYAAAFESITGTTFEPDLEDPAIRIPRRRRSRPSLRWRGGRVRPDLGGFACAQRGL